MDALNSGRKKWNVYSVSGTSLFGTSFPKQVQL